MLAGAALTATPSAADGARIVNVPCSTPALSNEVRTADSRQRPTVLRLAPACTYNFDNAISTPTGGNALSVDRDLTLIGGQSTTIRRDPSFQSILFRIIEVEQGATLRINNVSILNGLSDGSTPDGGGGILNSGTLTLKHVTLSGNSTADGPGGGLAVTTTGRAFVSNSVISGNIANPFNGGAGGGISNAGRLTLFSDRVSGNNAPGPGGGGGLITQATGTSRIIQSTFDNNLTQGTGGGVRNAPGGTTLLLRGLVVFNEAFNEGGVSGAVTIRKSVIRDNTCDPTNPGCTANA